MSRAMRGGVCAVLFIVVLAVNGPLGTWHSAVAHDERHQTKADVLLSALGDLRSFMAKMLWFKADIYHHGIESKGQSSFQDRDWVTLARFVTLLDPHFEEAYDTGAYALIIMRPPHQDEAEQYVDEGLRNNPDSFSLNFTKAFWVDFKTKHYLEAMPVAYRALQLAKGDIEKLDSLRCLGYSYHAYGIQHPENQAWAEANETLTWRCLLTEIPNDPIATARLLALKMTNPQPLPLSQLQPDFTPHP